MKRKMRPVHPGEILREEVINAYDLKTGEAAKMLGVSRQTLHNIIHEKSDITPDMAFRISQVFGGTADIWANMQTKYNLHLAAERAKSFKLKPYRGQLQSV
ncbi:addiction module antidote protein, HigA family [Parapedobacter luteus]|uniref:Addiction module antidote protein, HigA family n=1 Tax=Parapedobacter luteus TaxID=623280 RepID=A0A1T5CAQ2_9SPHI|nr:HigA family addiction module antitoxin [Parapedobacter luteus]SKB56441.1 addiction module antidote protein, HigA family [Parapedobacter luteus]